MDITDYNRTAWNKQVADGNEWTIAVSSEAVERARNSEFEIVLTPEKPVPHEWFGTLEGAEVLCLASGGGQQGPILAAAGAKVTVFDLSPDQLGQDRKVAERDGLDITTVEGDMRDLSCFADGQFDLVFHPCSNCFVPDIRPTWQEAFRVLKPGGHLLSGFCNPVLYLFDYEKMKEGQLDVRYSIPYSDLTDISDDERQAFIDAGEPLCFGHSLDDQIGAQLDAGFHMVGFYEDKWEEDAEYATLSKHMPAFIATRCRKPA